MPKAEWGVKRTCPNCEARFYDLQREPIVCPECGAAFAVDNQGKVSAPRERRAPVPVAEDEDPLVADQDLVDEEDADEDADEPLLADDDDEEEATGPALAEENEEEDTAVAFKGPDLIDGDDDVDESESEDDDDIEELDDLPDDDHRPGS